jgi:hypothetical protein
MAGLFQGAVASALMYTNANLGGQGAKRRDTVGEFEKPNPPAPHFRSGFPPLPNPPLLLGGKRKSFYSWKGEPGSLSP